MPFYKNMVENLRNESQLLKDLRRDIPYLIRESKKMSHDIKRLY